ncbi:ADAMTS-like protein 4 isoform X2 [Ostrea edulis]|uniref:ADAMTS-like protein 4 isoform X2 n=1 Tax=Ostrea edulis TaxID=37623 RepID=UPI0024AF4189|nr:ADAMTS-like protein 4 isoform X2 [Ostrea edulis]
MKADRLLAAPFLVACFSLLQLSATSARRHGSNHHARSRHGHSRERWSQWSDWSSCNAECGTGVSSRTRECLENTRECTSENIEYKVCNRQECVSSQKTLRQQQCSSHDDKKFGGRNYRWQPYDIGDGECDLTCRANRYGFYNTFPEHAQNGALCNKDQNSVCIEGICTEIGCDDKVGSAATRDLCGVCNGDGSTCRVVKDIFETKKLNYGYNEIGTLPAGATNINITQLGQSRNYIALRISEGRYFINGNRRLSRDGKYNAAGSAFRYHSRRTHKCPGECILSKGPTTKPIDIMVLSFGHNPGIFYQFSLPHGPLSQKSSYDAIIVEDDFGGSHNISHSGHESKLPSLSINNNSSENETRPHHRHHQRHHAQTDSGSRAMPGYTQSFTFMEKKNSSSQTGALSESETFYRSQSDKHRQTMKIDPSVANNTIPGANGLRWEITGYTPCSATCGQGTKTPFLECFSGNTRVEEKNCLMTTKPVLGSQPCALKPCPKWENQIRYVTSRWQPSDWSACSVTCGVGQQTRKLMCVHEMSPNVLISVVDNDCLGLDRPNTTQPCNTASCFKWTTGRWTQCSVTCGRGKRMRSVTCMSQDGRRVRRDFCDLLEKPKEKSVCSYGDCRTTTVSSVYVSMKSWYTTDWSRDCPVECGEGKQTRKVVCHGSNSNTDPRRNCLQRDKPNTERACKSRRTCYGTWFSEAWGKCNATCGNGYRNRDVVCISKTGGGRFTVVPDYRCPMQDKPENTEPCQMERMCGPQWFMSTWGQCSVTCGKGRKTRDVQCLDTFGVTSNSCNVREKPSEVELCKKGPCRRETVSDSGCRDRYSKCDLVVRRDLCDHVFYMNVCCHSCSQWKS